MNTQLVICPFCNSTYGPKATRYVSDTRLFHVVGNPLGANCGATGPVATSYEAAAAKWNRRAETEREAVAA